MTEIDLNRNQEPEKTSENDEDCYWDGPYLVFTEAYHLKRGYCCNSGCRHCPWKDKEAPLPGS
jgi:hypothetical protein